MRFDICPFFKPGENVPWTETIRMMREQARLAEETCFTTAWFTEHLVNIKTRNHRSGHHSRAKVVEQARTDTG